VAAGDRGHLYSLGTVFHLLKRLRFHNAIWRGFVLLAATCHYSAASPACRWLEELRARCVRRTCHSRKFRRKSESVQVQGAKKQGFVARMPAIVR
jgi:hypothetical protein